MLWRVFIFIAFFNVLSLFAMNDQALLARADKSLASYNKGDVFRAYNDYKSLYLKAVVKQDKTLEKRALQGIVASGKKLHIDVASYEKELRSLQKAKPKHKKRFYKQTSKKRKKINNRKATKLKLVYWRSSRLILRFSKNLRQNQVNFFKLYDAKKNIYKYVFDIDALHLAHTKKLFKSGIRSIRLAQFKPSKLRLVFTNDSVLKVRFKINKNELIINAQPIKKRTFKIPKKKSLITVPESKYLHIEKKTIVIDPGHGGKDSGAVGYRGYKEKDIVLQIGKYVRDYLKKRGYKVYMTRSTDRFIKLRNRTRYANRKKADLFVSIHANASRKKKAYGIETYFLSPSRSSRAEKVAAMENKVYIDDMNFYAKQSFLKFMNNHKIIASNKLAIDLQQGILLELRKYYNKVVDGGVREGPFWVLVGAQMPAVLIEVGFITNPNEAKRLKNKNYQKHIAKGIADGIERYFVKNR